MSVPIRTLLFIGAASSSLYAASLYAAPITTYTQLDAVSAAVMPTTATPATSTHPATVPASTPIDAVVSPAATVNTTADPLPPATASAETAFTVPFYSQFADISSPQWQKVGCGIASLAMLVDFYEPGPVSVDALLAEGIARNAYLDSAGWTYAGLIGVGENHGITGASYDLGHLSSARALAALETALADGPVMVSVHYTFDPANPIPHLVIATGIRDGEFHYNDPAEPSGGGSIPLTQFQQSWKQRYIAFWPA